MTTTSNLTKDEPVFRLYFAGSQHTCYEPVLQKRNANRLFSYTNDRGAILKWAEFLRSPEGLNNNKLFIDSGAFTAWTKGTSVNVDDYITFLNTYSDVIFLAGQVDCIAGEINRKASLQEQRQACENTWQNYLYMYSKLTNPKCLLYTFHIGEDMSYLKQALDWRDDNGHPMEYLALGGTVGKPVADKISWFKKCWETIQHSSNPNVKVHAFGMTSLDVLAKFPFHSADSTSWIMTGANGGVLTKYGAVTVSSGSLHTSGHLQSFSSEAVKNFTEYVKERGFSLNDLAQDYKQRILFNASYLLEWEHSFVPPKKIFKTNSLF